MSGFHAFSQDAMKTTFTLRIRSEQPEDAAGIIEAFAKPCLKMASEPDGPIVLQLMARLLADPNRHKQVFDRHFKTLVDV